MPTYAIGDIQGCFDSLQALLTKMDFDPQLDTLWLVGDLVNRGPKSLDVLRFVKGLGPRAITVLGNHDLHCLASYHKLWPSYDDDTLSSIFDADDADELMHWLRTRPLLHHDATLNCTMTHAGIYPSWDLAQAQGYATELENVLRSGGYLDYLNNMYGNEPNTWSDHLSGWDRLRFITNAFTRMRFVDQHNALNLEHKGSLAHPPEACQPWFTVASRHLSEQTLVFGHWAALGGLFDTPYLLGLDTGCVWGKQLTAIRLDDGVKFSQDAVEEPLP